MNCNRRIGADTPNVKDEPRPQPARLLQPAGDNSAHAFGYTFVSRRRDGCGRWLWRLVGPGYTIGRQAAIPPFGVLPIRHRSEPSTGPRLRTTSKILHSLLE